MIDTHVHADHLSRARALAAAAGATLWLPEQRRVHFTFTPLADGAAIAVGGAPHRPAHARPHRREHHARARRRRRVHRRHAVRGERRPAGLKADADGTRRRAARLHASLRALAALPSGTVILPGHAGSPIAFDGQPVAARLGDVTSWLDGWLQSEDAFVDRVVAQLPEPPANYARIVELNEGEADPVVRRASTPSSSRPAPTAAR